MKFIERMKPPEESVEITTAEGTLAVAHAEGDPHNLVVVGEAHHWDEKQKAYAVWNVVRCTVCGETKEVESE